MKLFYRRAIVVFSAAALAGGITAGIGYKAGAFSTSPASAAPAAHSSKPPANLTAMPAAPGGLPVLDNSCKNGYVTFTFDDGPGKYTLPLASELLAMHVPAVFFEIGENVAADPQATKLLVENHFVIGDHTWNHPSLTGASTGAKPLTNAEVVSELTRASAAIVSAGAPVPTLWRPPYGDVDSNDSKIATSLGLRLVMPWSDNATVVDNLDWTNVSAAKIFTAVTHAKGAPLRNGVIIAGHDGIANGVNTVKAMPMIVSFLNRHQLCATATVRPDATGGVFAGGPATGHGGG